MAENRDKELASSFYAFRNDLWEVGHKLLESPSRRDQRFGQFAVDLGYLAAHHYQSLDNLDLDAFYDDTWRESMRESMRSSAKFAQNMRLD